MNTKKNGKSLQLGEIRDRRNRTSQEFTRVKFLQREGHQSFGVKTTDHVH